MTKHDPYLTQIIDALGLRATIISLQRSAADAHRISRFHMRNKSFDHLGQAAQWQRTAAWYSRQARILMGVD